MMITRAELRRAMLVIPAALVFLMALAVIGRGADASPFALTFAGAMVGVVATLSILDATS